MTTTTPETPLDVLRSGTVIPAHVLSLTEDLRIDERRQRALTRYYLDAGVGGIAVGVHTTQFGIRAAGMYADVLRLAAETTRAWTARPVALVAGVTGDTAQAIDEAETAAGLGYTSALVNVAAWRGRPESDIVAHVSAVGEVMPVMGFALLPEVGGFHLSRAFWRELASLPSVVGIKLAPFDRYRTLDIVGGVVDARAEERITLYTGNDDHIVLDLLQPFRIPRDGEQVTVRIRGGLLGHWSVWTKRAVEQFARIRAVPDDAAVPADLLALDSAVTDANGAVYDARNAFAGCIPGCHEVLRRQGLFAGTWCLDPDETLSPGQLDEIDRVIREHPDLTDDEFVAAGLERWLA
ncbi:dihydrodipicolinate synthase family protein [Homoserinibacter sp. GY 40078]|uniref:dihydrodipicolinate synthase family protein n=1 Tax=Homoserinibacter sp. GY 40078 TaxID=2603275 RepID=UPI002105C78B|nr:dihydrodipicolinate synthase family protein [Homoserinibacter sp. GY 40078]